MERSDVRWQKRRKNRCGKPCTVHIAKDPGYLGLQLMSMEITTWIRRNTCMYAAATNGKDVARLLVDEYLNCHPTGHKKFMESMAKEQQEIKDNYTYLGFAWLKGLSEVRYYDLRNEASKLMADDLCLHVKEQPERVRLVYEGAEEMEINPSDEEQMAKMFTCYLLAGSMDGYGEFVDYALDTHRTLQQNLTRFFVEWFAKAEKGSAFLKRAKMVYSRYSLPYI